MVDHNITLGYWGIRGKGQVPRLLLAYTGLKFTHKNYTAPEQWFGADKTGLGFTFPNLPYLIDGDFKLTESEAICRYIIRRSGKTDLLGKDIHDQARVDNIIGVVADVSTPTVKVCFHDKYEEEKEKVFQEIKPKVDAVNNLLGDKDWLLGYITLADFKVAEAINYLEGIWPVHFKEYPKLVALRDRFNHLPEIEAYYKGEHSVKVPYLPPGKAKWTGL